MMRTFSIFIYDEYKQIIGGAFNVDYHSVLPIVDEAIFKGYNVEVIED